ncbi:hypothetical protein, partial [Nostoc sp. ChiQUE01b]|uniref:hypothetical protein n=1 Tax=Nostoc sp. ChiQUE01b TaxID=3075376 RepID=UPI002AD568F3
HLLFRRTHLLFRRTHLLFQRTHLLFRRVHNAPYETTRRVETYAGHTCVYTQAYKQRGFKAYSPTLVGKGLEVRIFVGWVEAMRYPTNPAKC